MSSPCQHAPQPYPFANTSQPTRKHRAGFRWGKAQVGRWAPLSAYAALSSTAQYFGTLLADLFLLLWYRRFVFPLFLLFVFFFALLLRMFLRLATSRIYHYDAAHVHQGFFFFR